MINDILQALKIQATNEGTSAGSRWLKGGEDSIESYSPVDGKRIAAVKVTDKHSYDAVLSIADEAFREWRLWPAPRRGEVVRQVGEALRREKETLGKLVS